MATADRPEAREEVVPPARVGDWFVLGVGEHRGRGQTIAVSLRLEGDLLYLALTEGLGPEPEPLVNLAWCPEVRPRPDLAEEARGWLDRQDDPLREKALAALLEGEPFRLLDLMPPLLGPGFVRDRSGMAEPILVQPDGSAPGLPPLPIAPDAPRRYACLWDGGAPTLIVAWDDCFALIRAFGSKAYRLIYSAGRLRVEPDDGGCDAWHFLMEVSHGCGYWSYGVGIRDLSLAAALRSSMGLATATHRGYQPRYGVGPYDRPEHNAFPPATLSTVEAEMALNYGISRGDRLTAYMMRYVRDDGSIDYYGTSLSEYGQLLDLAARLAERDWSSMESCPLLLQALARRVAGLLAAARDDGSLVPRGLPEADYTSRDAAEQGRRYLSNGLWLLRGRVSWSRLLRRNWWLPAEAAGGATMTEDEARAIASRMVGEPLAGGFYRADIDADEVFERMTESWEASYTNYRFWPEMLSSGLLPREAAEAIVRWRQIHGGELMGMTRFADHLDDWPVWHYAQGLLQLGEGETYTMLLWAHLFHHQMPGWLSGYEQAGIVPDEDGWRRPAAGQVVPCQTTAPLMLAAGLLWHDPTHEELWVLPAGELFLRSLGGEATVRGWEQVAWGNCRGLKLATHAAGPAGEVKCYVSTGASAVVVLPERSRATAVFRLLPADDDGEDAREPIPFQQEGRRVTVTVGPEEDPEKDWSDIAIAFEGTG